MPNTPTRVALYACIHDDTDPVTIMRTLHEMATNHGWEVTASLYDTGPLTRPPAHRLAWRKVTELLDTHRIHGVVAPDRHHVDPAALTELGAITAYRAAQPAPKRHRIRYPADPTAVQEARHALTTQLKEWSAPEPAIHTAELILSELLTNAILHTDSRSVTVEAALTAGRLRLAVTDDSPARPHAAHAVPETDERGRGLALVSALASAWGSVPMCGGKTVWASLVTTGHGQPGSGKRDSDDV